MILQSEVNDVPISPPLRSDSMQMGFCVDVILYSYWIKCFGFNVQPRNP